MGEYFKSNYVYGEVLVPRELIGNPNYNRLGPTELMVYALLRDKVYREGLKDGADRLYVMYSRLELSKQLNVSTSTITRAVNILEDYDLIDDAKAARIYVKDIK